MWLPYNQQENTLLGKTGPLAVTFCELTPQHVNVKKNEKRGNRDRLKEGMGRGMKGEHSLVAVRR